MSWTEERVELLTKLWGDGLSASQIAGHLGGVTRNAVIGKVHRLKLETRLKTAADGEQAPFMAEVLAVAETVVEAANVHVIQLQASVRNAVRSAGGGGGGVVGATAFKMDDSDPEEAEAAPAEAPPRPSGEVVPIARNLTLVQLTERTCKWPLGDPLSPDFRFCGNHSNDSSPYCQYHARIAFQPASERRRVR